jgi:hypothetical protein
MALVGVNTRAIEIGSYIFRVEADRLAVILDGEVVIALFPVGFSLWTLPRL